MSGRDNSMTIHEYTVISIPAFDSDMLNDFAMSVSKPIGINSDVLNMNAETVIPTREAFLFSSIYSSYLFLFLIICGIYDYFFVHQPHIIGNGIMSQCTFE